MFDLFYLYLSKSDYSIFQFGPLLFEKKKMLGKNFKQSQTV